MADTNEQPASNTDNDNALRMPDITWRHFANPRIAILICVALIAIFLLVTYHLTSLRRAYYQARIFGGQKNVVAIVFEKEYFKGGSYLIKLPENQDIREFDQTFQMPFKPGSIIPGPGYQVSIVLPKDEYEYFPPRRCMDHLDNDICVGDIIGLRITSSI